jgi:hypothetical protein
MTHDELHQIISEKMNCSIQGVQHCQLKHFDYHRIVGPITKRKWLGTLDINNVMKQYSKKYIDFQYLGTFPIDFKNIYPEVYNLRIQPGMRYGCVFNTDPSTESGEHWISLFIDEPKKSICFFDSNGDLPQIEIINFMNHLNKKNKYTISFNNRRHQKKDGNCGLYAINFILMQLNGISCRAFQYASIPDESMDIARSKLFRRQ